MHIPSWRGRLAVMGAMSLAAVTGLSVRFGRGGDPPPPRADVVAKEGEKSLYLGARFCARCHEQPRKEDNTDYVCLTEYTTWSEKDKHSQAYKVLTEQRSREMWTTLGWKGKVTDEPRCLNCHAANVSKELRSNDFDIHDGVSCDACHGPASRWIVPHADKKWRTTSIADKQKLGLRNVRDPVELSRLCVSCHVGSIAENKVVTHEMYAAGHPPLPSIEIATFCKEMPPHWRYLRDKNKAVQQQIRTAFKIPPDEQERTKLTVIGAVVAFQASMELLGASPDGGANEGRIELANYDCYACHHELKIPSWRQKRGYAGRPGRPTMHTWPTILLQDVIRYADDPNLAKQYDERMQKLRQAFDARPFGYAKQIAERSRQLREWSQHLLHRLQKVPYNSSSARRLVRGMCASKEADKYDYDSARQKAWAIEAILSDLELKQADRLTNSLAELRQQLKLDLPSGTKKQILLELSDRLRLSNKYDADKFKTVLEKLGSLLSRE
ncbi:MAG: multiheme c-type cytochrome [Gemmataceae bacterium]